MQVLLAEEFGFCFGVERAVEMTEEALAGGAQVRTLGPLIHNTQEIKRLEAEGVTTINAPEEADPQVTAVIRAHGVTPEVQRDLEERAGRVIDATCPFVTKVQKLAERAAEQGRDVVVVGNPDHPEMIGVVGYAPRNSHVVRDASEVARLPNLHAPLVVSQTTLKLSTFLEAAEAVRAKSDAEPQIVNTICSATRDRQDAARALAGEVEAFYIIGGKHSSNSIKLLSVCKEQCAQSYLIETPEEINADDLRGVERVGVTAGASTPNWLIEQVVERLRQIGEARDAAEEFLLTR
ncbi:MAG TPA: 4-hydroxy-3-methylbut-2-enyl diphosphate reductase [Pyrinomonadaceae bacterium]|jgi:4-hydroxy-3-methylbut-2-enyl diphosphate reductase|nr:4-hydroxy-3-methylbut-2-enyl diphosphate reductase [Pyrinomonadaceae bacterium]